MTNEEKLQLADAVLALEGSAFKLVPVGHLEEWKEGEVAINLDALKLLIGEWKEFTQFKEKPLDTTQDIA